MLPGPSVLSSGYNSLLVILLSFFLRPWNAPKNNASNTIYIFSESRNCLSEICLFSSNWGKMHVWNKKCIISGKFDCTRKYREQAEHGERTALENEREGRYTFGGRLEGREGRRGGGRRKRSDNPSKLTPSSAPGEMQIWSICHVCLGILILVRGWGFSLAALWRLPDPPAFLSPAFPSLAKSTTPRDRPRWAENCLRIGCRSGFRDPATFSSFILPFPPFSRKEVDKNGAWAIRLKTGVRNFFGYISRVSPEPACLYFISRSIAISYLALVISTI